MATQAVAHCALSIRLACRVFGVSEGCYRYQPVLAEENQLIADWLLRITASQRKMALYRNIRPLLMDASEDRDTALLQAQRLLISRGVLKAGDVYAITCGEPMGHPGGTNMLKIVRVD